MTDAETAPIEVRDPDKVMSPALAVGLAGRRVRLHSVAKSVAEIRPYMAACKHRTTGLDGDAWGAALKRGSVDPNAFIAAEQRSRPGAKLAPSTSEEADSVIALLSDQQCLSLLATLRFRADQLKQLKSRIQGVAPTLLVPARWQERFLDHLLGGVLLSFPMHHIQTAPWIDFP